jgi:hypothetical protein
MIDISTVQTFDHELTREPEVLTDPQSFLIYVFC